MDTNSINRAELRGRIGQDPKITSVGDTQVARFSLATNETFKDREAQIREEVTWHNIVVWQSKTVAELSQLKKGTMVHLVGRIRNSKYKSADGDDRYFNEIVALQLKVCNEEGRSPLTL